MYKLKIKFTNNDKIYNMTCKYMYRKEDYIYLHLQDNNIIEINWNKVDFYYREFIGD